jgi:hypothetical protein
VAGRPRRRPQDPRPTGGTNPKLSRPSANNTSTELSPAPSSRTTPTPINDSRRARHSSMVTATSSVRIKHHGRTLHLRPAASDRNQGDNTLADGFVWSDRAADCRFWLFEIMAARFAAGRRAACVPSAASLCRTSRTVISRVVHLRQDRHSITHHRDRPVNRPSTATDQKPATSWAS